MRSPRALLTMVVVLAAGAIALTAEQAPAESILDILFGRHRTKPNRPSPRQTLQSGQRIMGLSGVAGVRQYFRVDIPAGTAALTVSTAGGQGDCDLYLSREALPEPKSYQYASTGSHTDEAITIRRPTPGTWHVLISGYGRFDGVALTAAWTPGHLPGRPGQPRPPHGRIRLTSPAVGAALTAGESYWVQWTTSGRTRRIRALQSLDGGATWTDIAPRSTAPASAGRLVWTIPRIIGRRPAVAAHIRLVDMDRPALSVTSGAYPVVHKRGGQPRRSDPRDGRHGRTEPYEPNNRSERASRIDVNTVQDHTIRDKGDEDWLVFVPPMPGTYRITFSNVAVELKVRLYTTKVGSDRESKYRTLTVKKRGYSLDVTLGPTVRHLKFHVEADDDDDTGGYRVAVQQVVPARPSQPPRVRPRR